MGKRLIVIGGPTASGKTSLAINIAQHYNTKILSADSRQCYKELNIGVAKPSIEELESVQHFFIDSHSIHEEVTAGEFERFGLNCLETIFKDSDVAVCVGGTGLYIKALCEGLDDMPHVDALIKQEVEQEFEEKGLAWLQKQVQEVDPVFYDQIDTNNYMRLLRGLIFYKSNQSSILSFQKAAPAERFFDIEYYSIAMERNILYDRINRRVDIMIDNGLLQEAESLNDFQSIKALQTVGYKELFAFFKGEISQKKAIEKIKQHTRNYAKRQMTWFKNQGPFNNLSSQAIFDKIRE